MNRLLTAALSLSLAVAAAAQGNCGTTTAGAGCGATLAITFTPSGAAGNQRISVQGSGMQPNTIGLMVWGYEPANVPISAGCNLLVEFAWGHLIQLDALGEWGWSRVWPASSMPGSYYIQLGSIIIGADGTITSLVTDSKLATCN